MVQRPRAPGDVLDSTLFSEVVKQLKDIQEKAEGATYIDDLDDFIDDAKLQGLFAAYLCPATEIKDEGELVIDLIAGGGVPKGAIDKLRGSFAEKLAATDLQIARSALYALFSERDSWDDYIDEYEDTVQLYTRWLFGAIIALPVAAVFTLYFAVWFSPLLLLGFVFAGAAGSCVSIMSKMPALEVSLSGELDAYGRRVFSRIGTGLVASLLGCASLAWIPVSIQNQTFADAVTACTTAPCTTPAATCTTIKLLILLSVPMLLGFSERH